MHLANSHGILRLDEKGRKEGKGSIAGVKAKENDSKVAVFFVLLLLAASSHHPLPPSLPPCFPQPPFLSLEIILHHYSTPLSVPPTHATFTLSLSHLPLSLSPSSLCLS